MSNRLQHESSPYLLQHAENPVDWFPWGEEAFRKAKTENKPLFLSIGCSTCHWCHVMAHESFEDAEIAQIPNQHFIAIYKRIYDRENGGFGHAPKFPTPHNLLFLMTCYERQGDQECLAMAERTLLQMYRGGLFDHIGFGFCRNSTDEYYLVPHFEKMLRVSKQSVSFEPAIQRINRMISCMLSYHSDTTIIQCVSSNNYCLIQTSCHKAAPQSAPQSRNLHCAPARRWWDSERPGRTESPPAD